MIEMKTTGLGFAQAVEMKAGGVVVVGGVLRRVMEVKDHRIATDPSGGFGSSIKETKGAPYFDLSGTGWVSWQQCAVYAGRTAKQLAQEAIEIQNACNPLGLSKGYARALQELRWALEVEGKENDTDAIKLHPINRLWLDKLCDLAQYGRMSKTDSAMEFVAVYDEVSRLAGLVTTSHTGGEHDMGGE